MAGAVPTIPGEPDALRDAAASFDGCGGRLDGLAASVAGTASGLAGGWSGLAAQAATAACAAAADPLTVASAGFDDLATALRRFASELEQAQKAAERAQAAHEAARAAATTASGLLLDLSAELDPDPTGVAHLQGRLDQANADAEAAGSAGQEAFLQAKAAARAAAAAFEGVAGRAPDPPPPPPPPPSAPKDEPGFFERAASGAWDGLKDGAGAVGGVAKDGWKLASETGPQWLPGTPAYMTDVAEGAAGVVGGTGMFLWEAGKATSPVYGAIDPEGQEAAQQGFKDGFAYAKEHPWETTKQVLGIHHLENGEPGKLAGEAGLTALLAVFTGGGSVAARGATGVSRVSRAGVDKVAAAGRMRAATNVDDVRALGRHDYADRLPGEAENFAGKPPVPVTRVSREDEWLVGFGDASKVPGERGRSVMWWTTLDEARGYTSLENLRDRLALPERWEEGGAVQVKDEALIIRVPAGTETTRLEGIAEELRPDKFPDPRPGGGHQIAFREVDLQWVEARMRTDDLLAGRLPRGVGP